MAMVKVDVVVSEPIQVDADDHDWDAVVDFQVILPMSLGAFDEVLVGVVGKAHDAEVVGRNGRIYFNYEWQRQNSPEIDRNSLPRRIQVQASEFSENEVEEKWVPISGFHQIECNCGEPECKAYLIIEREDGSYITAGDRGHIQSVELPPNIKVCKLVE